MGAMVENVPLALIPLGYAQVSVAAAAVALPAVPTGTTYAVVIVTSNAIRSRDDGTAPTAAVGMPWGAGSAFTVNGTLALSQFLMIATAAAAELNVSYYKAAR